MDLLTLVEMRYDKQALAPYEAVYEAESEGCYGTVVDALHMILRLSKFKYDVCSWQMSAKKSEGLGRVGFYFSKFGAP